jgi:hypothetical protein
VRFASTALSAPPAPTLSGPQQTVPRAAVGLTLALYLALLAYMIPRHEPWADEAQAWELAKYLSLKSLFGTYIHYEGSPGLWHALLWMLARMHVTYAGMHWITGAIAFTGMALLVIAAPFPLFLRMLLPFTYFFAFQYSVIARSYALFPPILFALACLWPNRERCRLAVVLLIGLLANVSVHGLAVALGLTVVLAIEQLPQTGRKMRPRVHWLPHLLLLVAMLGFAGWCAWPAPDAGWVVTAHSMVAHDTLRSAEESASKRHPWLAHLPFKLQVAITTGLQLKDGLSQGLSNRSRLGLIAWFLLFWGWMRSGRLRYILPVALLALLCRPMPFHFYHAGLLWVLFLFLWWVTIPQPRVSGALPETGLLQKALILVVTLCVCIHLVWAGRAIRYDAVKAYSPNRDGAILLQQYLYQGQKAEIAIPSKLEGDGISPYYITGLEPYFAVEPFGNMPFRFWFFGWGEDMRLKYLLDSQNQSVIVIVEETEEDPRYKIEEKRLEHIGYVRDKVACGQIFYPDTLSFPLCHAFYVPQNHPGSPL